MSTARVGVLVVGGDREAALLAQLVEREAAAGGIEQVGGELGVEDEVAGDVAERLGVVRHHRPVAGGGDQLGRVVDLARQRLAAARVGAEAPALGSRGISSPSGASGATATSNSSSPCRRATSAGAAPALTGTVRASAASGRGIASASAVASASSSRRSGSRSSQSRKTGRRFARSGIFVSSASRSRSIGTSRTIVASCLESRAASACSIRFCLRLAPEISSTLAEHGLEVAEALEQLGGGLVADARDAGDVVAGVALEADEVGDLLRRDAVALDHALAVVDLGVGDPAARSS